MSIEYERLIEEHREQMENLFAAHEERMALAQKTYEESIRNAQKAFESVVEEEKETEPPKQTPQAVWIKAADSDGEDMLLLNREAAIHQMALLDRLAEVLKELTNLTKKKR